jgi:hypothetical protein
MFNSETPPYIISVPECILGEKPGYYMVSGIEFTFYNASVKSVSDITVSFTVYDAETLDNPFIGTNNITTSFNGTIDPQKNETLIIPLDTYIYVTPEHPYLIDFFYIKEIKFTDGSSWQDQWGTYAVRSKE